MLGTERELKNLFSFSHIQNRGFAVRQWLEGISCFLNPSANQAFRIQVTDAPGEEAVIMSRKS